MVFHYGIFPQSVSSLAEIGVRLHALATWRDVLAEARAGVGDLNAVPDAALAGAA